MIILVPPLGDRSRPGCEAHYPYSDPLYDCINMDVCDCLPKYETHRESIEDVLIGGRFDGRLTGQEAEALSKPFSAQVLERLFALHDDHWAVGCTVQLQFGTLQKHCTL